jgi:hypothetical protein
MRYKEFQQSRAVNSIENQNYEHKLHLVSANSPGSVRVKVEVVSETFEITFI